MVASADNARLAVYPAGRDDGPLVLFVHGWAQSAACWRHQLADAELADELCLVAMDLRGHGRSDVPDRGYDDPRTWADDVHAVLDEVGGGRPAVLVGWSYGALVIADHLGRYGTAGVAGVLLTGAITGIGRGMAAGRVGPVMRAALPAALSDDPAVATPALATFVRGLATPPLPAADAAVLLDASIATPPTVRAALFDRTADGAGLVDAVRAGPVPVLVQHGTADAVVDPTTARHHLATIPGATADWWDDAGHALFVEDPRRFGARLLAFVEHS